MAVDMGMRVHELVKIVVNKEEKRDYRDSLIPSISNKAKSHHILVISSSCLRVLISIGYTYFQ